MDGERSRWAWLGFEIPHNAKQTTTTHDQPLVHYELSSRSQVRGYIGASLETVCNTDVAECKVQLLKIGRMSEFK